MHRSLAVATLVVLSVLPVSLLAQQDIQTPLVPSRDQQAVSVITQCLNGGGGQALATLQDYTGKGNITYFWAGQEVNGAVTVQSARQDQFRLDARLPTGTRSWVVDGGQGATKETDGKESPIPLHNGLALGSLTFPFSSLLQALKDPSTTMTFVGASDLAGTKVNRVRIQQSFPAELDINGDWKRWSAREYWIDAATFRILSTRAVLRSNDSYQKEYVEDIDFSDYRQVNGVAVPFSIVEKIGGQKTWSIQLDSVSFNTGLTDATFQF